ncbi:hypothetical protein KJI55_005176 [Escherichia coli]|nr:hypothetical protein [Escherichia coli]EHO7078452.1 hypothetical protein [Escherichia coli]
MNIPLHQHINNLPQLPSDFSFGKDIDSIHKFIFKETDDNIIEKELRKWASVNQPCVFGKLACKKIKGLDFHLSIIKDPSLYTNDSKLFEFLRRERIIFKERALKGEVSAHLIYFIHQKIAFAKPSKELVDIQKHICSLHMPEYYPVREDIIYTESIPLQENENVMVYKAGVNIFYSSAHRTRNHDRRIPGGMLISVNAPGHFMRLAIAKGFYKDQEQALSDIRNMTIQSIGKGGYSHPEKISTTWHSDNKMNRFGCPIHSTNSDYYSGFYHTDVLIPGELTQDSRIIHNVDSNDPMIFNWNVLFYVSLEKFPVDNPYYGEFLGIPVDEEAKFFNPFPPRAFENKPLYNEEITKYD